MIKKLPHDQISKDIVTKWQWGSFLSKKIQKTIQIKTKAKSYLKTCKNKSAKLFEKKSKNSKKSPRKKQFIIKMQKSS